MSFLWPQKRSGRCGVEKMTFPARNPIPANEPVATPTKLIALDSYGDCLSTEYYSSTEED
jgi:hypothetical protein